METKKESDESTFSERVDSSGYELIIGESLQKLLYSGWGYRMVVLKEGEVVSPEVAYRVPSMEGQNHGVIKEAQSKHLFNNSNPVKGAVYGYDKANKGWVLESSHPSDSDEYPKFVEDTHGLDKLATS